MSRNAPEFSRRVPLTRLTREPSRHEISADPAEREGLARRFGLIALDRLSAAVVLRRTDAQTILLEAEFEAECVQECVVSLESVPATVAACFALRYAPAATDKPETAFAEEEPAFEPLEGEAIDIGEAVAQELSLALPRFPRDPAAVLDPGPAEPAAHPFAGLARLGEPEG